MRRASILTFLSVALLAPSVSDAAPKKAVAARLRGARHLHRDEADGSGRLRQDPGGRRRDPKHARIAVAHRGQRPAGVLPVRHHAFDRRAREQALAPVVEAFNAANTVALEYLESESPLLKLGELVAAKGLYTEGNGLKDLLTPAELATLRKTLGAEGLPANAVHLLRPWFAGLVLALPACEKKRSEAGLLPSRSAARTRCGRARQAGGRP